MIRWPERYSPEATAVHARTAMDVPVARPVVWGWIVRAGLWPDWYPHFREVEIEGGGIDLADCSRFRWKAFGVPLSSRVEEFVPPERIAWTARALGVDAYHAWVIEESPSGCRVLTEENQNGLVARLNAAIRPRFMESMQRDLLERLRDAAAGGPPPSTPHRAGAP
ncbi:MAG: SRPBCC family protein [Nitrososphaerota archaeon]|nr:SRPBCC family protein [Nitrososphaerota archaeon]